MSEMRERLALAIVEADRQRIPVGYADGVSGRPALDSPIVSDWGTFLADAVLDALREPDSAMLKAARDTPLPLVHLDSISARQDLENATRWRSMLTAAKGGE